MTMIVMAPAASYWTLSIVELHKKRLNVQDLKFDDNNIRLVSEYVQSILSMLKVEYLKFCKCTMRTRTFKKEARLESVLGVENIQENVEWLSSKATQLVDAHQSAVQKVSVKEINLSNWKLKYAHVRTSLLGLKIKLEKTYKLSTKTAKKEAKVEAALCVSNLLEAVDWFSYNYCSTIKLVEAQKLSLLYPANVTADVVDSTTRLNLECKRDSFQNKSPFRPLKPFSISFLPNASNITTSSVKLTTNAKLMTQMPQEITSIEKGAETTTFPQSSGKELSTNNSFKLKHTVPNYSKQPHYIKKVAKLTCSKEKVKVRIENGYNYKRI